MMISRALLVYADILHLHAPSCRDVSPLRGVALLVVVVHVAVVVVVKLKD
jgi:hypothetical protein